MDAFSEQPPEGAAGLRDAFARAVGKAELSDAEQAFIAQAGADLRADELPELTPADLGPVLAGFWDYGMKHEGPAQVRLRPVSSANGNDLRLDLLEIVQQDAPFLVDSIMGALASEGLEVRAMTHPVVTVGDENQAPAGPATAQRLSMILVVTSSLGEERAQTVLEALSQTLADVHAAVDDFGPMTALMGRAIADLANAPAPPQVYGLEEHLAFLRWLTADHFVFLGAREYTYPRGADGSYLRDEPLYEPAAGLGLLRDPQRSVLRRASEPAILAADPKRYLTETPAVVVAKSNLRSRVHRRTHLDYVGVRQYAADGSPSGEIRFVGLFTADAYEEPTRSLPLVRRKVENVLTRVERSPSAHTERRLKHIVETYPRDDLFQIDEDTLLRTAAGILHLYDRPRVRLFAWKDPFDRFLSLLLFVPRDHYHADTPKIAGEILARAWGGRQSAIHPRFADEPLARIHLVIGVDPGEHPDPDIAALEAEITEALRSWDDRLEATIREAPQLEGAVAPVLARWRNAFPAGYRDRYDTAEALVDLAQIEALVAGAGSPLKVRSYRRAEDPPARFRIKLYVPNGPAPLSDVLPILDYMGLKALDEAGFPVSPVSETAAPAIWVHDYLLEDARGQALSFEDLQAAFEAAFAAVWTGKAENDGFNRLVLDLGVPWREAALIRALARWRQQSGLDPSQAVQEAALHDHPGIARLILDLFRIKFDPAIRAGVEARREQAAAVYGEIEDALQAVQSLDDDRVLRRIAQAVRAMTRTNYFQLGPDGEPKPYISFKIASGEVEALPAPKPFREIFVASRQVEGVHTRFGPVARGGLRWSDRRDDFRTEVLGLVRTQQVKNAVIVPVGAKGGFYPKRLPKGAGAEEVRAEAVAAYKTFLSGLLDLTDTYGADAAVIHPEGVIAHDADDPYLVVAADKGTATFSDIANGVARDYGFWLDDAFASGGSAGYDHKAMGITARGAWEAVKRHFRELGKDIQTEPFTCVGVGDMSGDVFGNGLLLSKATKLVAAFDHRHVFLDPDPDPETSWAERKRLFDLPRSSWGDYDPKLISKGGGIFPRTAKQIPISPEVKALLGVEADELATTELIHAILTAPVELLYLGGIGTYVKAPGESHADVSDKANDAVRVDATELRCKVVGEGANLGFTQAGRIAYARAGGRINTDAIDNSAGVDTSDHEVNIKILLQQAILAGDLAAQDRDALLLGMTDEVGAHVLAHNYAQTLALSLLEAEAPAELGAHARFMANLVATGRLDRRVEGLPGPAIIADLRAQGLGLTRPELAVILAYAKLELSAELVAGPAPDDPYFEMALKDYFPDALARFEPEMKRHRLRREIIATVLANAMVDRVGPTFAWRAGAALGCDASTAAAAFEAAREVFRLEDLWGSIAALDLKIDARLQLRLFGEVSRHLRAQAYWLARRCATGGECPTSVQSLIGRYQAGVDALTAAGALLLSEHDRAEVEAFERELLEAGAPEATAKAVAALGALRLAVEIVDLAAEAGWAPEAAARLFHQVGAAFGFDRLRGAAAGFSPADDFERRAVRQLIIQLVTEQAAMACSVLKAAPAGADQSAEAAQEAISAWAEPHKPALERARTMLQEIEQAGEGWSFAKLALAHAALREAASSGGTPARR